MRTIGDLERIRRHHAAAAEGARLEARRAGLEVGERLRAALGVPADATKARGEHEEWSTEVGDARWVGAVRGLRSYLIFSSGANAM